jgi:hypothetical protein
MTPPSVYKVCTVGRAGDGRAYVRYTGVPGCHIVNPNSQPPRIQLAFRQLMSQIEQDVYRLTSQGHDVYAACVCVAEKHNELHLRD